LAMMLLLTAAEIDGEKNKFQGRCAILLGGGGGDVEGAVKSVRG
jgi:hypothetical protein